MFINQSDQWHELKQPSLRLGSDFVVLNYINRRLFEVIYCKSYICVMHTGKSNLGFQHSCKFEILSSGSNIVTNYTRVKNYITY